MPLPYKAGAVDDSATKPAACKALPERRCRRNRFVRFIGSLCVSPVQHQALRRTGFSFLPFSAKYDIIDIREHRKASPNIETRSWQHAGTVDPAELS
jgi:hypothetical protein